MVLHCQSNTTACGAFPKAPKVSYNARLYKTRQDERDGCVRVCVWKREGTVGDPDDDAIARDWAKSKGRVRQTAGTLVSREKRERTRARGRGGASSRSTYCIVTLNNSVRRPDVQNCPSSKAVMEW